MHKVLRVVGLMMMIVPVPAQAATSWATLAAAAVELTLASAGTLAVQASPATAVADGSSAIDLAVTLRDGNNTPMALQALTLSVSGSSNRLGATKGVTDGLGLFSTTLKSTQSGRKTITITSGGLSGSASVRFVSGDADVSHSSLTLLPATAQLADGNAAFLVAATIRDRFSNPVPGFMVTPVSDSASTLKSPASGLTGLDGVFVTKVSSQQSGRQLLTVQVGTGTLVVGSTFHGGEPNSLNSTATLSPNSILQADGNDLFTWTVALRDDNNNPVANYPVAVSSNGLAVNFSPAEGTTNSVGVVVAKIKSKYVGTTQLFWAAGPAGGGNTVTFKVGTPKSNTSFITAMPSQAPADGNTAVTLTGIARDASGNPVAGLPLTFSASGANNTLSTTQCVTDTLGSCVATLKSTKAENKLVYLRGTNFEAKGVAVFVAGAANVTLSSLATNTNATLVANGYSSFSFNTKLVDAQGNPVTATPVTMSSTVAQDVFKPLSGPTNNVGVFTTTLASTVVGQRTLTATSGSLALHANAVFGVGPMSSSASVLVGVPQSGLVADGVTTSTLTAYIKDAQGRVLANKPVTITSSGYNNHFSNASPVTDANGYVQVTMSSTRAENKKVLFGVGAVSLATQLVFVAGSPNQAATVINANPAKPVAALSGGAQMKVTVVDAFGNACTKVPITFSASGGNNTFSVNGGLTNTVGSYYSILSSTLAETKTVRAQVGNFSVAQNITLSAAAPSAATTTFTAAPGGGILANGVSTATLQVTVRDVFNNPVVGQSLVVYINDRALTFAQRTGPTDASGRFTTTVTSTAAGTKTINMQAGSVSKTVTVTFVPAASAHYGFDAPASPMVEGIHIPQAADPLAQALWAIAAPPSAIAGRIALSEAPWGQPMGEPLTLYVDDAASPHWVVGQPHTSQLLIYRPSQNGRYTAHDPVPLSESPRMILASDFNGDGLTDLVIAGSHTVTTLLGASDASYRARSLLLEDFDGDEDPRIAIGDFNGDGWEDVAVAWGHDGVPQVFYGLGNGEFAQGVSPFIPGAALYAP